MTSNRLQGLPEDILNLISESTYKLRAPIALAHAARNLPQIKKSVLELPMAIPNLRESAVVIAAGPSLRRQEAVARLKPFRDRLTIIATDGALINCLQNDVIPDVVVSVDPSQRIVRWLGDPRLHERNEDDYFRRQDIDVAFRDEHAHNSTSIELVNRCGAQMKAALSTSIFPEVTERYHESGMDVYWWNPIIDDWDQPDSYTRKVFQITGGIPCLNALGHCGGAAWSLAHAVLRCRRVGIVGMDLGYPNGTKVINTQFYEFMWHLPLELAETFLIEIENPYTKGIYLSDPVYYWYRFWMIEAIKQAECVTVNCSGEGTLFGDGVLWQSIEQFVSAL